MLVRLVVAGILSVCFAAVAEPAKNDPLSRLDAAMHQLNALLDNYAHSTVLRSSETETINNFFMLILRRNPYIQTIARIRADGEVVNYVDSIGVDLVSRSVKGERWFTSLRDAGQPHIDIFRDARGDVYFFRAWPLSESGHSTASRFNGAFAVKVDFKKYLQVSLKGDSRPMKILFHGKPFYSGNWDRNEEYIENALLITGSDELRVQYPRQASSKARSATAPPPKVASSRQENDGAITRRNHAADSTEKHRVHSTKQGRVSSVAKKNLKESTLILDSIHAGKFVFPLNRSVVAFAVGFAGMISVAIAILIIAWIRKSRRNRRNEKELFTFFRPSPSPIEAVVIKKEEPPPAAEKHFVAQPVAMDETEILDLIASAERETKELPALKELIVESARKLNDYDPKTRTNTRIRIFHELQADLHVWASGEIKRLIGNLNQLVLVARDCERKHGDSSELQEFRREIGRMVREIEALEKKLPQKITV